MTIESAFFTNAGPKGQNQDAFLTPLESGGAWWSAIADGMGGHSGGEVASHAVIEAIRSRLVDGQEADIASLFSTAKQNLESLASLNPSLANMGTTLSVICMKSGRAEVGHVGDTRIYHLRGNGILGRTKDQTEVQRLIEEGVLSKASARKYPRRNVLLSVLAPNREYELYREEFDICRGDRIILLTDGVYKKVHRREIRDLSLQALSSSVLCSDLLREVKSRGPDDDYTSICITIDS